MSQFQHIVVGIDFSEESEPVLNLAVQLAECWHSRLSVLHVIDDQLAKYWDVLPMPPAEMEATLLEKTKERMGKQLGGLVLVNHEAHVIFGKPFQSLTEYCTKEHADLLVVGQRGARLLERILLGSTASRLMRHSPVPLLTVHPQFSSLGSRLLVGIDFSEISKQALEYAAQMASGLGLELHVLHVGEELVGAWEGSFEMNQVMEQLKGFISTADLHDAAYELHLVSGVAHHELAAFAELHQYPLLVLGTVGRSGLWGLLAGNTAESVAAKMPCSLLTFQGS